MKTSIASLSIAALLFLGAGCVPAAATVQSELPQQSSTSGAGTTTSPAAPLIKVPSQITVKLRAMNGVASDGTAIFTPASKSAVRVTVTMPSASRITAGNAEIRSGHCGDASEATLYTLSPLVEGRSVSNLNLDMAALISQELSLWIKPNPQGAQHTLVICGNIF